jgi:hypothetical protein
MTQLSTHFQLSEFEKDGPIPAACIPIFGGLANLILEPIRTFVGRPLIITSGYRPPAINQQIHGATNSEHVASPSYCAADFEFITTYGLLPNMRTTFNWIRSSPTLPFHQVIFEHSPNGSSIIHISINTSKPGVRQALEGATYNASAYSTWPVADFSGEENA